MQRQGVSPLTVQLLEWISGHPRNYGQAMEAWRTSCPRHSVWEDALLDGLIQVVDKGAHMNQSAVVLTDLGRALLERR